jgi:tRNA G18 (ribose-2'-O)-methylase SpoU
LIEIDDPNDPRLIPYRHVGDPVWLRARGLFVAEGRLVVARLLDVGYPIESVLVTPAAGAALDPARLQGCVVLVAPPSIVNGVTGFNFHRGCLAIAPRLAPLPLDAFTAARRVVILEGVGNPDNVGGVFRSAAALGADGVLLGPGVGDPLYRKAMRTSMGAALRLPFAPLEPWPDALASIRPMGFQIVALTPAGTTALEQFAEGLDPGMRLAILAGAEGPGLTGAALSAADVTVRIPVDARSDSLNVVVAVSIALERLRHVRREPEDRDRTETGP